MRAFNIKLLMLAVFIVFYFGLALAQDAINTSENQEISSGFEQLSDRSSSEAEVLGRNIPRVFEDVTETNLSNIFLINPAVNVNITEANPAERWVEVTNQGIFSSDLTGWKLSSQGNITYTFPAFELNSGASVKVREGMGVPSESELYTSMMFPLEIGDEILLHDASGNAVGQFQVSPPPEKPATPIDPFKSLIQF
jgi:hypothetical protein